MFTQAEHKTVARDLHQERSVVVEAMLPIELEA